MKNKFFILPLLLISLFFGTSFVSALSSKYLSSYYDYYSNNANLDTSIIDNLISYYNSNLSSTYSHYIIYYNNTSNSIYLYAVNETSMYLDSTGSFTLNNSSASDGSSYYYSFNDNQYHTYNYLSNSFPYLLYSTDVPFTFSDSSNCSAYNPSNNCYDTVQLPSFSDLTYDVAFPQININSGDTIPTYMSLTNGQPSADFTTVDMSQYDYIILSLRDYNTTTFNTTIYSLGRLCFTPVYNYGMTQKQDYIQGYQTMGCTENYSTSTPVSIYIIQADLDNHAVYYIKRYSNETNILKIPTSIFDISYITNANANNPTVSIGGRTYPTIPYSELTDTANISSDEGYISGQVCALGDVNCEYETGIGLDITDIFTQPLTVLENVWASITSVFLLITKFIMLIPSPLREFLIASFMLAVVLGLIKIIL